MPSSLSEYLARTSPPQPRVRVSLDDYLARPTAPTSEPSWLDTAVTTGLRVVPSVIGGAAGALAGVPSGPGAVATAVGGGAAGGALGEFLAQQYEKWQGLRDETNLGSIAVEGGLGAIPLGKSATLARAALKAGTMGVAGTVGHSLAEEGELPSATNVGLAALLGGGIGAGGEAIARRLTRAVPAATDDILERFGQEDVTLPRGREEPPDVALRSRAAYEPHPVEVPPVEAPTLRDEQEYLAELARERYQPQADDYEFQAIEYTPTWNRPIEAMPPRGRVIRAADVGEDVTPFEPRGGAPAQWAGVFREEPSQPSQPSQLADLLRGGIYERGVADVRRRMAEEAASIIPPERQLTEGTRFIAGPGGRVADLPKVNRLRKLLGPDRLHTVDQESGFTEALERAAEPSPRGPLWDQIRDQARREGYTGDEQPLWEEFQKGMRSVRGYDQVLARSGYRARRGLEGARSSTYEDLARSVTGPNWWRRLQPFSETEQLAREAEPAFLHEVDELAPTVTREPGQEGFIAPELASSVAGAAIGGAGGATQGETPEEHLKYGLLGAALGAGGGYSAARLARRGVGDVPELRPPAPLPKELAAQRIETAGGESLSPVRDEERRVVRFFGEPHIPPQQRQPKAQREAFGLEKFPEEQRGFLKEVVAELNAPNVLGEGGLEAQRRGLQSNARTKALASHLAVVADKVLAPGTNRNAAEHLAYGNALATTIDDIRTVSKRVKAGTATDEDMLRLGELNAQKDVLFASYAGLRSEAGRALQIYRLIKSVMPGEMGRVRDLLERGGVKDEIYNMARIGSDLSDDPVEAYNTLFKNRKMGLWEGITNYYMANILSGIKTQERNILGNSGKLAARTVSKAAAGGLDLLRSTITGKPREVFAREAIEEAKGLYAGLSKALLDGYETFTLGFSPAAIREAEEGLGELATPRGEFRGGLMNPFNVPGRLLDAADRVFRQMNGSMELYGLAYSKARKAAIEQGLTGEAADRFIAEKSAGMRLAPDAEMKKLIHAVAARGVMQENAPVANQLNALKKLVPGLHFVMPFVKTVSNIMKQGAEHSPLGFVMRRGRGAEGAREQAIARGEAAMGSLALLPLAYAAATGRLSGSGPTDPAKRAALYESGWRPNSVQIGDSWVSYNAAGPFAFPASIVANGYEAWQEQGEAATSKEGLAKLETIFGSMLARVGRTALDQSFLSGVGDLVKALEDPERSASGFMARMAQGFVPLAGLNRNIAQAIDPTVRAPEGITESLKTGIPFLSETVAPRLTRFGEEATRGRAQAVLAPETFPKIEDPVADELMRLGVDIGVPTDRIGGVEDQLTPEVGFQVRQTRGRAQRVILSSVMQQPGYEQLPDVIKAELLKRALRSGMGDVNELARVAMKAGRPELLGELSAPLEQLAAQTYTR